MSHFDLAIVGAGIAGASLAAAIGDERKIVLLEAESAPGYHSTGRSAAFWSETYGGPGVQPLTSASGPFLLAPPEDFCDGPLLRPRGCLHLGQGKNAGEAQAMLDDFARSGVALKRLDAQGIGQHLTGLRDGWSEALWEPDCCDIDVAALHAGYLKAARRAGAQLICHAPLEKAELKGGRWELQAGSRQYTADMLVNAAGAWADPVAVLAGVHPLGITPYRRTIMQLAIEPAAPADLPLVVGLDGSFYFKPEAGGKLWLSPHDEIACDPCDVAPEEMDVALAIERFGEVVDWRITRLERKWAGLRSFAPDRLPVIGHDPDCPAFFWLAGQGGFGIQTAPAAAAMAAALLLQRPNPVAGTSFETYAPERFR